MNQLKFSETISALRKEKGMTQQELADILGVTNKAVSRWETGDGYPEITLLKTLAEALDVNVDFLMTGEVNPKTACRYAWMDFLSCFFLVITWTLSTLPGVLEPFFRFPGFIAIAYLMLLGLTLYFRKNCYPVMSAGKGRGDGTDWCNAYKIFIAVSFYPVSRLADIAGVYFGAGNIPDSHRILFTLVLLAILYYVGINYVTTGGIDKNRSLQPSKRSWLNEEEERQTAAFNWFYALAAATILVLSSLTHVGTPALAMLIILWVVMLLAGLLVCPYRLNGLEPGKRRLYLLRNSVAASVFLIVFRLRIETYWVNSSGRRVDPELAREFFGARSTGRWILLADGEHFFPALAAVLLTVIFFEIIICRIKNKE